MARAAAPAKPAKPKVCNAFIKGDDLKLKLCGGRVVEGNCKNKDKHVMKYKTGFCQRGWCEGTNPKTHSQKPAPTCKMWATCPCKCHTSFDTMFAMADKPRTVVNNSEYHVPKDEFWMPTAEDRVRLHALSNPSPVNAPVIVESPLPDAVPATIKRTFTPTASGRAARGELESWVKDNCDVWLVEEEEFPCTPAWLSEEIGRQQGIKPPSVGAISAVFERWVKIDFAVIEKKPTRFTGYTEQGVRLGLDGCKDKAKRMKRNAEAQAGRRIGKS